MKPFKLRRRLALISAAGALIAGIPAVSAFLAPAAHASTCTITQDASTPTPVWGNSNTKSNLTTASFTPPSGALMVLALGFDAGAAPSIAVSDTAGNTWTQVKGATNTQDDAAYIYEAPVTNSAADTVKVTLSGYGPAWSAEADVRVLDGTAASQSGAASSSAFLSGTALSHNITTTQTGSWVIMMGAANHSESSVTPLSTTATLHEDNDTTFSDMLVSGKQASATGTPGTETIGWNVPTSTQETFAAKEILPGTTCGGGGGTHFMDFGPSAACPDGSGTGCSGNPNGYPLSASTCANSIVPDTTERIPENATQNATMGPSTVAAANYGPWTDNTGEPQMERDIQAASGQYTGTTDDILEWAACSEGWNENWLRAEAVVESSWQQSTQGDSGCSQGILQVRACQNPPATLNDAWGGYSATHTSTAFAAEMQASYLRACFDGSIDYLYPSGQTVASMAAAHGGGTNPTGAGWQYVAWGCVGSWFSGDWYSSAAQSYISQVQSDLSNQSWNGLS